MAELVVLDANVIVALLYEHDSLHARGKDLVDRIVKAGSEPEILDFPVLEALSVVSRRSIERRSFPPNFAQAVEDVRALRRDGTIRDTTSFQSYHFDAVLDVMVDGGGKLNANDAFLVVLQRLGEIDEVATFDENLAAFPGFKRFA